MTGGSPRCGTQPTRFQPRPRTTRAVPGVAAGVAPATRRPSPSTPRGRGTHATPRTWLARQHTHSKTYAFQVIDLTLASDNHHYVVKLASVSQRNELHTIPDLWK